MSHIKVPRTAGEALTQTLGTLRQLAGPSGLGIIQPSDTSKQQQQQQQQQAQLPRDHDIHKLSTVCMTDVRRALSTSLDVLKASVLAHESWPPDSTQSILRVKADTVASSNASSTAISAISVCRRLALTEDPFATRPTRAAHRLCALAEKCGATVYRDDVQTAGVPSCEINVAGTRFMIVFSFSNLSALSDIALSVNFRFLVEATTERPDAAVSESFANLVRRERFTALHRAFDHLMRLERLSDAVPDVSLCDALRAFEDDLLAAQEIERKANVPQADRVRMGHGVMQRTAVGLRISFMEGYSALLGVEHSLVTRQISTSHAGLVPRKGAPAPTAERPMPLFDFGECVMAPALAQYVLTLNKRVFVTVGVAQMLERVAGVDDSIKAAVKAVSMRGAPVRALSSGRDGRTEQGERRGYWPSLQRLLAPGVFGQGAGGEVEAETERNDGGKEGGGGGDVDGTDGGTGGLGNGRSLVRERSHWSQTATEFVAAAGLPDREYVQLSHSGGDVVGAVALRRVGICHPRHVGAVLAVLRQQIVFNELFESCFGKPLRVMEGMRSILRQPVEVVVCESPSVMQLNMFEEVMEDMVSMVVTVGLGGELAVTLKSSSGRVHFCSDRKATLLLEMSRSVPLTIRSIVQLARSASAGASTVGEAAVGR